MLERIDREVGLETLIRWSPAVFLVHDLEEVLTVERFWRENRDRLPIPAALKDRIGVTTARMAASVAFVFAASLYASRRALGPPKPGAGIGLFGIVISVRLTNAFFHLLQTLALQRYSPGVLTALVVSMPHSLYVLHRLRAQGLLNDTAVYRVLGLGALLHTPVVLGAQTAGRTLVRLVSRGG